MPAAKASSLSAWLALHFHQISYYPQGRFMQAGIIGPSAR